MIYLILKGKIYSFGDFTVSFGERTIASQDNCYILDVIIFEEIFDYF